MQRNRSRKDTRICRPTVIL